MNGFRLSWIIGVVTTVAKQLPLNLDDEQDIDAKWCALGPSVATLIVELRNPSVAAVADDADAVRAAVEENTVDLNPETITLIVETILQVLALIRALRK